MPNARRHSRHLLFAVWLVLLVAGCMTQLMTGSGVSGGGAAGGILPKDAVHANADWQANADGTTALHVHLAPPPPDPLGRAFRVQDLQLSAIDKINVSVTAADITTPIVPTGAGTNGDVTLVTPGTMPALTFPSIPAGTKRMLRIQGYQGGVSIAAARVAAVFDNLTGGGSFEVSQRSTPAADIVKQLTGTTLAAVSTSALNTFVDQVTVPGGSYPYTYATHPALVDATGIVNALNANSGNVGGLATASTYRMPGAKVTFSFYMDPGGAPTASDQPRIAVDDPSSKAIILPHHAANTGAFSTTAGTTTATFADDNQVTVTINSIAPTAAGGQWKVSVFLPGDNTAAPHGKYYAVPFTGANQFCGHGTTITVTSGQASGGSTVTSAFTLPPLDPKYAAGQVRWRDDSLGNPAATDIKSTFNTAVAGMGSSSSSDFRVYVGPTTAATPSYGFTSTSLPAAKAVEIIGPASVAEGMRPRFINTAGTAIGLSNANQALRDIELQGTSVAMAGGMLQRVSIDNYRVADGANVLNVINATGGTNVVQDCHLYDLRNTAPSITTGGLCGILYGAAAGGTIANVVIDDNFGIGDTKAVRLDNPGAGNSATLRGIEVDGPVDVNNCQVIRLGYVGASGADRSLSTFPIAAIGNGANAIRFCTVANAEAKGALTGILANGGSVANCTVRDISHNGFTFTIKGIQAGSGTATVATDVLDNTVSNLGSTQAGATVAAVTGSAPQGTALRVMGNSIANCQATALTGVLAEHNGISASETILVKGNRIYANTPVAGAGAAFHGIDTSIPPNGSASVTVQDNDLMANTLLDASEGIRTRASAGTSVVHHNRISGNIMKQNANGTYFQPLISLEETGASTTCSNNLITNNSLVDTAATGTINGQAILVKGSGAVVADVVNNLIYGNSYQDGAGDGHGIATILAYTRGMRAISNRIFDITYSGSNLWAASHAIQLYPDAQANTNVIDHNIVSVPFLGAGVQRELIACGSGTGDLINLTYNSLYAGDSALGVVVHSGSGQMNIVQDNVIASGGTAVAQAAVVAVSNIANTLGQNTVMPWTNAYFNGASMINGAGALSRATMPFANLPTAGNHSMALTSVETPTGQGGTGDGSELDSTSTKQRGAGIATGNYTGGAPSLTLYNEPTWP
jgi:hypothetical protein